jgi:toxin CptA
VNWAGVTALFAGIFATWLFMYGILPATQGPIAVAMGGLDLSWLAGGLTSATVYAILGPRILKRYAGTSPNVAAAEPASATAPKDNGPVLDATHTVS